MKTINILIICFLLGCSSEPYNEKVYLCRSEQKIDLSSVNSPVEKVSYVFLVSLKPNQRPCDGNLLIDYPGYKETKRNTKKHPNVWGLSASDKIKIDSKDAFEFGCSLADNVFSIGEISKTPHLLKEYYPDFK